MCVRACIYICVYVYIYIYIQTYTKFELRKEFLEQNTYVQARKRKRELTMKKLAYERWEYTLFPGRIHMRYVPQGPRDLNNIVCASKYTVRRKDGLMCINITLRAHERTIPHASVFSSQQLNSTSNSNLLVCHTVLTGKPIAALSSTDKQSLDYGLLNPIQSFQMFAGTY